MTITEANAPQLATPTAPPEEVARLIELIRHRRGFDLSEYKRSSLARSIARRASARYARDQIENVDAQTKRRYFTGIRTPTVRPFLRRLVCFGTHNLVADPPISQLDLITCRNVLIYLEKDAQIAALNNLRYGLVPGGYLVLGKSEKLRPEVEAAFEPIDTRWQVYRKIEGRP